MTESLRFNVREATPADIPGIQRFDARMKEAGREERISYSRALLGRGRDLSAASEVAYRLLIAEDGEEIRAAALLLDQELYVNGEARGFSYVQMPVSEGILNRTYALAIVQLIKRAVRMRPLLISLGVGARDAAWSRFVVSLGWQARTIPFLFYPVKPQAILRRLGYLDQRPRLKLAARVGAASGLPHLLGHGLGVYRWALGNRKRCRAEVVEEIGSWADEIFHAALPDYSATAARGAAALRLIYPRDRPGILRLHVKCPATNVHFGWVVACLRRFSGGGYFGDLNVGVLADGFGRARDVPALIQAGMDELIERGAEIVVANWSHGEWLRQCRRYGFVPGPSNYHAFFSPTAASLLPLSSDFGRVHLTRGDSDGLNTFQFRPQPEVTQAAGGGR